LSTLRAAKLATPVTVVTVVAPASTPPAGFVASATVTLPVKLGSVFPKLS